MIMSDGEIRVAIEEGRIGFDPALSSDQLDDALSTSALDLRLGPELYTYPTLEDVPSAVAESIVMDPTVPGGVSDLVKKWARVKTIQPEGYRLGPHQLVLGATLESITLPASGRIAARVEGKSTLARLGFVAHMTAPTVHCGFEGNIVLEMYNFGPYPIRLTHGMRVCQVIFEELGATPVGAASAQYQNQTGPTGAPNPSELN